VARGNLSAVGCPNRDRYYVEWEGIKAPIVNSIHLFCGGAATDEGPEQVLGAGPVFNGPHQYASDAFSPSVGSAMIAELPRWTRGRRDQRRSGVGWTQWASSAAANVDAGQLRQIQRTPADQQPG